jgi:hypothetical protein
MTNKTNANKLTLTHFNNKIKTKRLYILYLLSYIISARFLTLDGRRVIQIWTIAGNHTASTWLPAIVQRLAAMRPAKVKNLTARNITTPLNLKLRKR